MFGINRKVSVSFNLQRRCEYEGRVQVSRYLGRRSIMPIDLKN